MSKLNKTARLIALGAFIRTVRETGKAPKVYSCLVSAGMKHPGAIYCRKMEQALKDLKVYGTHRDGKAFLYKDNWDGNALLEALEEHIKTMPVPKARTYKRSLDETLKIAVREKAAMDRMKRLDEFSEEELIAELNRREEARKAEEELIRKKALLTDAAELIGISIDELISIATELAEII